MVTDERMIENVEKLLGRLQIIYTVMPKSIASKILRCFGSTAILHRLCMDTDSKSCQNRKGFLTVCRQVCSDVNIYPDRFTPIDVNNNSSWVQFEYKNDILTYCHILLKMIEGLSGSKWGQNLWNRCHQGHLKFIFWTSDFGKISLDGRINGTKCRSLSIYHSRY